MKSPVIYRVFASTYVAISVVRFNNKGAGPKISRLRVEFFRLRSPSPFEQSCISPWHLQKMGSSCRVVFLRSLIPVWRPKRRPPALEFSHPCLVLCWSTNLSKLVSMCFVYVSVRRHVTEWVCMCVFVRALVLHVCAYMYLHALFKGILLFNAQIALVSFSTAVDHATTICIKKSFTSIASMLSGFSFFSIVVRPRPIFGNIPSV